MKSFRRFVAEATDTLSVAFARKPSNLQDILAAWSTIPGRFTEATPVRVTKRLKVSADTYDAFVDRPLDDNEWFASFNAGRDSDGAQRVLSISAPGRRTLYVDTQGYGYARYIGVALSESLGEATIAGHDLDSLSQVVDRVNGRDVTRAELLAVFDKVEPRDNWKGPIDVYVSARALDPEMIKAAVRFFTGSVATVRASGDGVYHVTAKGYYAAVGP